MRRSRDRWAATAAVTASNPAFAGIIQGMKSEAEKFGYKFLIANSNNSANQQIATLTA